MQFGQRGITCPLLRFVKSNPVGKESVTERSRTHPPEQSKVLQCHSSWNALSLPSTTQEETLLPFLHWSLSELARGDAAVEISLLVGLSMLRAIFVRQRLFSLREDVTEHVVSIIRCWLTFRTCDVSVESRLKFSATTGKHHFVTLRCCFCSCSALAPPISFANTMDEHAMEAERQRRSRLLVLACYLKRKQQQIHFKNQLNMEGRLRRSRSLKRDGLVAPKDSPWQKPHDSGDDAGPITVTGLDHEAFWSY